MGRKKYFCDFCLKSCAGDPKGRALHLNSARHIQIRKEYYASFTDPETILNVESFKPTCPYLERGCRFGVNCNFSHYFPDQLQYLQELVDQRRRNQQRTLPSFEDWCRKQEKPGFGGSRLSHELPAGANFLPVSLWPFDIADYVGTDFVEWGN